MIVTVYHSTSAEAAEAILRDGFRDGRGSYGFVGLVLEGVFVAPTPVDENEGATSSEAVLAIELDEAWLAPHAIEEMGRVAEYVVPAELLNAHPVRRLSERERDKLLDAALRHSEGLPRVVTRDTH